MKKQVNKQDTLLSFGLAIGSFFILTEGNKWSETFVYTLAITITLYSYLIASAAVLSFAIYSIWAMVKNLRAIAKLRIENMEMMKCMTRKMNEIAESKNEQVLNYN